MKILVINPGSTTTKLALFEDSEELFREKIDHAKEEDFGKKFGQSLNVFDQLTYRLEAITRLLEEKKVNKIDAVAGRGGMMRPVVSGTYQIGAEMIDDLKNRPLANHASNLGAPLALAVAEKFNCGEKAFIVDPVTTDEIERKHKLTGIPGITRYAAWHALNQKAVARKYAQEWDKRYEDINLIVAHLGGGFSFGAHRRGKAINVINALSGEGPYTPERAGAIPAQDLIELCFSGEKTKEEIMHLVAGGGGLFAHLGTKSLEEIERDFDKLKPVEQEVVDEMIAGISRSICSLLPDFEGTEVEQVIITGGIAQSKLVIEKISKDLSPLEIDITVYPGEMEMEALRDGVWRVLEGGEKIKSY